MVNDPAVRPFVGAPDAGELDLSPIIDREENLFPFGEHGGFAAIWTAPRAREVHTFILPSGRGKWARDAAREGVALMKAAGTALLWTRIPDDQPNVRAYAVGMGMKPTGEVIDTLGKPYAIYAMGCDTCQ